MIYMDSGRRKEYLAGIKMHPIRQFYVIFADAINNAIELIRPESAKNFKY